jgi:transcription-repair coupling factor (superfamily II helicase)
VALWENTRLASTAAAMSRRELPSPLNPPLPAPGPEPLRWGRLYGSARALAIAEAAARHDALSVVVAPDAQVAARLDAELRFFAADLDLPVLEFPDWETLPYDVFSPHEDIISQRLRTLAALPRTGRGLLIVAATTLLQRIAPRSFLAGRVFSLRQGDRLDIDALRRDLDEAGYRCVGQVMEHGEFSVRGSLVDLYPMGSAEPYRIDLLDDEIDSIRRFDPDSQRSVDAVEAIRLLPAHEFPLDDQGVKDFRRRYRVRFEGDPNASMIYREVSQRLAPAGIEYYLPLFFDQTETLLDHLPEQSLLLALDGVEASVERFEASAAARYEQRRHDVQRPLLAPAELFSDAGTLARRMAQFQCIEVGRVEIAPGDASSNLDSHALPTLTLQARAQSPANALLGFLDRHPGRVLFVAESPGRREQLLEVLAPLGIRPEPVQGWGEFLRGAQPRAIAVAPLEEGLLLSEPSLAVIPEALLIGERAAQARRRRRPTRDADAVVRNLTDLHPGAPVVHEEHGVGRYLGLQRLTLGSGEGEFLALEYAGGDKLYVPVGSLQLVSRYTGASPEAAPLHRLGGEQWARIRRKAAEQARDVAAELLDVYARRAARSGRSFEVHTDDYARFAAAFPFEETPDQQRAIEAVLEDMAAPRPMDRVICGDVGFGKTEVAMRAAFVAAQEGCQVAILVPTTLLAQQHLQNLRDRFADWPLRIEGLSRFSGAKKQQGILQDLAQGRVDIVVGTHKLLGADVRFKNLGLVVVDEEHRFGVRHKERLKALRAEVDLLTLTATPIPRTLNMSLAGLRDLSIIATPPVQRHAIKTFVGEWNDHLVQEAVQREIRRGGQVYFLHNEVETIEKAATRLRALLPEAGIRTAHGQMRERELESTMLDFYHQRFNVLVCTTIIESGIDVPTANTIVIERADKLGLSQLHQLRGRVGRSHHRAYAYLITPPRKAMTADAVKRLEAVESLEDLGVGFTLATHDLEIRGAGELLGDEQSGQIQAIGFGMYNELLERAVTALKSGRQPELDAPLHSGPEVDLGAPALLPDDYVPDVHTRLILYKRISAAKDETELRELQVELVDRFGLLPESARTLFEATRLKLRAERLGVTKLDVGAQGGRIVFCEEPNIDPGQVIGLIQADPQTYRLDGGDRLRFAVELPAVEERVHAVEGLFDRLELKHAA